MVILSMELGYVYIVVMKCVNMELLLGSKEMYKDILRDKGMKRKAHY